MSTCVVIGAGVAGLATACLLQDEGYEVTVVDRLAEPGGRAGRFTDSGFQWDTGPSWYLMPEVFERFFGRLGHRTSDFFELTELSPAYRIFNEAGHAADIDGTVVEFFDQRTPGQGARLGDYLATASDTYRLALKHFLYTTFSHPSQLLHPDILRRLPRLAKLLGQSLQSYVGSRFSDPLLRQVLTYPAVFLSTEPAAAPALYSLMSHADLTQGVRYPQGGFAAVIDALLDLATDLGVHFQWETEATAIVTHGKQATEVTTNRGTLPADLVVSAADLHHTETRLVPAHQRTFSDKFFDRRDPGLSAVLVLTGVRGPLPELAHHNLLFSRDWDPDFDAVFRKGGASNSIYVCKTSASDTSVAPEGCENLFILVPAAADAALGQGSAYGEESATVAGIASRALDQLAEWANVPDLRDRVFVQHTIGPADFADRYHSLSGGAIGPAHTLFQSAFFRGRIQSKKIDNLFYAGATTVPGVGVPMCLISAENVLTAVKEFKLKV
ncbi:phytoene desaturase family protein [Corynebacterium sp. LK2590]|uniref:phytoene desaturase family protein n=1 Tax=unclassified Corynebacterium TaxID=2624378 RepID=UPI0034CDA635